MNFAWRGSGRDNRDGVWGLGRDGVGVGARADSRASSGVREGAIREISHTHYGL